METESQTHAELILLYEVSVSDLTFFKRQQWAVTNYALLLYAALFGLAQLSSGGVNYSARLGLLLLATVILIVGIWLLWRLEKSITVRKLRLKHLRDTAFSYGFRMAWKAGKKEDEYFPVSWALAGVLLLGAGVVWWYIGLGGCIDHGIDVNE